MKKFLLIWLLFGVCSIALPRVAFSQSEIADAVRLMEEGRSQQSAGRFVEAKMIFQSAAEGARTMQNIRVRNSALIEVAYCDMRIGNITTAKALLDSVDREHRDGRCTECHHTGRLWALMAYCELGLERVPQALAHAQKAVAVSPREYGTSDDRTVYAWYVLGLVKKAMAEYDDAMEAFAAADAARASLPNPHDRMSASIHAMRGTVYDDRSMFDSANAEYRTALSILAGLGLDRSYDAATYHLYQMSTYGNGCRYEQAIAEGKRAIALYDSLGFAQHANMASTYSKMGEMSAAIGDDATAREYFEQALSLFRQRYPEKGAAIGNTMLLLADVLLRSGDTAQAISYSEQGLRSYAAMMGERGPQTGFRYIMKARIDEEAGKMREALLAYQAAIECRSAVKGAGVSIDLFAIYTDMVPIYLALGNVDSARVSLAAADRYRSDRSDISDLARWYRRHAEICNNSGQRDSAVALYRTALSVIAGMERTNAITAFPGRHEWEQVIDRQEALRILEGYAAALLSRTHRVQRSDRREADRVYRSAMDLADIVRKEFLSDGAKYRLSEEMDRLSHDAFRNAAAIHSMTGSAEDRAALFTIADRNKGNVLRDRIAENSFRRSQQVPDSLIETDRKLSERISRLETLLLKGRSDLGELEASRVKEELFSLRRHRHDLRDVVDRAYSTGAASTQDRSFASIGRLQNSLGEKEVLLQYMVDARRTTVMAVAKHSVVVKSVLSSRPVADIVLSYITALRTYDGPAYSSAGSELTAAVFTPVRSIIPSGAHVIIVPDGPLCTVPFESLPLDRLTSAPEDYSRIGYLLDRFEFSYAYSAAFFCDQRSDGAVTGPIRSFAGFAPVFSDSTEDIALLANRAAADRSGLSDVRSITVDGRRFNPLIYSGKEVASIAERFRSHDIPGTEFLNNMATEKNFRSVAGAYDIVHVATHGFNNDRCPELSAVVFSQPSHTSEDEDGVLYLNEVSALRLNARLVVLSSCESGVGRLVNGEGMIALSRALLSAGAKNVIYSLWKVPDRPTYQLMDSFYDRLLSGGTFSSALREAKVSMRRSSSSAFPGKWSGFLLVGQ